MSAKTKLSTTFVNQSVYSELSGETFQAINVVFDKEEALQVTFLVIQFINASKSLGAFGLL
jgi:hypothetical protein